MEDLEILSSVYIHTYIHTYIPKILNISLAICIDMLTFIGEHIF